MLTRIILHNFVVFVVKKFWVFISYTVHRNSIADINNINGVINNINGVINRNLSFFFFPSDIKLGWKAKQKQRELTKNQLFFISFSFSLKIQNIGKSKTTIFGRGWHKKIFGSSVDHFSNRPICTFCKCWSFIWRSFFLVSILNESISRKMSFKSLCCLYFSFQASFFSLYYLFGTCFYLHRLNNYFDSEAVFLSFSLKTVFCKFLENSQ